MTLDEAIEFIVAKTELLAEYAKSPQEHEFLRKTLAGYDQLWSHPRLSLQQLRSLDGEMLEQLLTHSTSRADANEIRRKLMARFKTSRLRKSDHGVAKRVLKRGHIADLEEYYQVKEFVSCVDNIDVVGEENYGLLDSLLENYDGPGEEMAEPEHLPATTDATKPSRRRPPPAFDLTLADDEKLCPPDTPLETRVAFVRAKFARVIEQATSPELRASLQDAEKHGLELTLGPATSVERRNTQLEWCEHEAEFFAGYAISGTTHRAIEAELEKQFGFRRLGPSAQERLRRMLRTNDPLGRENRLFIERFIYAYPHQTLFTREEIKRAEKLLKAPSPSQPPPAPTMHPRPKIPPDLSALCVGAVFETKHDRRPHRVIAFDEFEVFYDVSWGGTAGQTEGNWTFGASHRRCVYYRHATPLFLDGAKKLRVDAPSATDLTLHRPDLPLRFARSPHVEWCEQPFPTREALVAYLQQHDPSLLQLAPLNARELALIPRSPKGAWQRATLVNAENGTSFSMLEILWHAHQLQRPFKNPGMSGIGIYRAGLEKKGVPSFLLSCHLEPGSVLDWYVKAPVAP